MTPARILVVEDDRIVARDIEQQLHRIGHVVVARAARGDDAIRFAIEHKPNLVLMDVRLEGDLDGIDTAERIKEHCRAPVIFLTAYADDHTVRRASHAEPFGYLIKPFEDSQLRTAIEMALYKYAADQRARESDHRYAVTLASIGDAVVATDKAGAITFLNPAAQHLLGWDRAAAIGRPLEEVVRLLDEETGGHVLVTRDGREIPIDDNAAPILDDAGEVTGAVLVFRDVTQRRQAEEAQVIRQTNARMELALRGSSIALWDFEMVDGSLETARMHAANLWGEAGIRSHKNLGWNDIRSTWHPEDRERLDRELAAHLAGETPLFTVDGRVILSSGEIRTRLMRGIFVRDGSGAPRRFVGTSTDITDLVRIEETLRISEERYRSTFENAPVGFIHTDFINSSILRVNQTYLDMTGWSREEALGPTGMEIIHPDDREETTDRFRRMRDGDHSPYVTQFRIFRKDGEIMWVRLTCSVGRDRPDGSPYIVGIVEDISERYRLERELQRAKDAAEASNRAKDEFLANVSHEIRTPMNAILGMTELVLDTKLTDTQRQSLRTVKSAAGGLLAIINDLLDFSKIEAGKLELDSVAFPLRALLGDTMRALAMRAHRKGIELMCNVAPDVPDALVGDAGRLRQVLINLVGNAIKFTARGEVQVNVVGEIVSPQEVIVRFAVRDSGIGIPLDKQESIFRAFEQEDMSTTRRYGGTGLGLTISSRLVAMMGGTITVESTPKQGSTFSFDARFGWHEASAVPNADRSQEVLSDLRVLIVDDNAANRDILVQWLRAWQMQPTAVSDGLAAMDALWHGVSSRSPYALILLDARMPDTDGLTLATKVRERAELAGTRIILLTSGDRPGDLERIRELRIDAHVLKPVPQDELLETIHDVMTRPELAPAVEAPTPVQTAIEAPEESELPLRVLAAEDNPFSSQLLRQLLASRGHAVRIASHGREALALAKSGAFDLLLLDLHMPELDGFQVIAELRDHERQHGGHLPVIALTARSRAQDRARCFDAGMDDFLAKPIQAAELWAAIERAVSPAHAAPANLISSSVLLATVGGDETILAQLRDAFRSRLPHDVTTLESALQQGNADRLRDLAHGLAGMLAAFSTHASTIALELEDVAGKRGLERAAVLVGQLKDLAPRLLDAVSAVSIASLESDDN